MTDSEKKMLAKIKRWLGRNHRAYQFWFTYNEKKEAVNWEGGSGLILTNQFRNEYTITAYSLNHNRKVIKNW